MDQRSFDRLARLLGGATDRRAGLKAALGALLGGGSAAAGLDAEAAKRRRDADRADRGPDADRRKKRRKTCKPACEGGFDCVKVGRKRECVCATKVACGEACCRVGETCQGGACVPDPEPGACLAFGDPCKNAGKRCCAGLSCASGQDGAFPVACYRSKGAACAGTAECPYGMSCTGGICVGNGGGGGGSSVPTGQPCASGQTCSQPGATCTAYTGDSAPSGDFCSLPLRRSCGGDVDCTCYTCWYVNGGAQGSTRASLTTKGCCHPTGETCATETDCCHGLTCTGNVCTGTMCVPTGGQCTTNGECCNGAPCDGGTCASGKALGATCGGNGECLSGLCWYPQDGSGNPLTGAAALQKVCVVAVSGACTARDACGLGNTCTTSACTGDLKVPLTGTCATTAGSPACYQGSCTNSVCMLSLQAVCVTGVTSQGCPMGSTCQQRAGAAVSDPTYCLLDYGDVCTVANDCVGSVCQTVSTSTKYCVEAVSAYACGVLKSSDPLGTCQRWALSATGTCEKVANTNALCTLSGGATGYCHADGTCSADPSGVCDVVATDTSATDIAALRAAIDAAPYKGAIGISGTFTLSSATGSITIAGLGKWACADVTKPDNSASCSTNDYRAWDLTIVRCDSSGAILDGGATVTKPTATANDPDTWSWANGVGILVATDYSLTIRGVDFRNGNRTGSSGGAIEAAGGRVGSALRLEDLTVSDSKTTVSGGGVYCANPSTTLKNITLSGNRAQSLGGGLFAGVTANKTLTIDGVAMTQNRSSASPAGKGGAGIFAEGTRGNSNNFGTITCLNQSNVSPWSIDNGVAGDCTSSNVTPLTIPAVGVYDFANCGCEDITVRT